MTLYLFTGLLFFLFLTNEKPWKWMIISAAVWAFIWPILVGIEFQRKFK